MKERLEDLLGEFTGNNPASTESVALLEQHFSRFGKELPSDLREIFETSDGAEGFVNGHYLILWSVGEIFEYNKSTQVDVFAPGLILFGSSGGGETYAFDSRGSEMPIVKVPNIGMSLKDAIVEASTLTEFLEKLAI
jgi:hypothetical protein